MLLLLLLTTTLNHALVDAAQAEESVGTVYVGNLAYDVTENDLSEVFSEYGSVKSVSLPIDRETGRPRGFGFVEMENSQQETKAIEKLDGAEWMGRELKVNIARAREERSSGRSSRYRYVAQEAAVGYGIWDGADSKFTVSHSACKDGIVNESPRPYVGQMSLSACEQKATEKQVSFVWGNGELCHLYNKKLNLNRYSPTDGRGSWKTCTPATQSSLFFQSATTSKTDLPTLGFAAIGVFATLYTVGHYVAKKRQGSTYETITYEV